MVGLRILLHGERYCVGGEPKEPIKFRVTEGGNLKSPIRVRSRGRSFGHQVLSRVSAAGKKMGNSNARERLKREDYDDTDDDNEEDDDDGDDDDEFDVDELACFSVLVLDISYRYCTSRQDCTIDHVLPISRGGEWKWENLVTACSRCNSKKGHKTLEESNMKLIKIPKAPKDFDILAIPLTSAAVRMLKMRKGVPGEWLQYLSS
ncbi:hypothetical protein KSP40_PGU016452 [Platanthera guangdongensis]|uniref:HNH nuclease domain-containing protein n=1 Tax=Platanthera guangdongensis TaxID=2320717 RepID=A0ABR2MXN8_9ASPA